MTINNSASTPLKQWRPLAMPPITRDVDIARLLQVCGRALPLRVVEGERGAQIIEVFCATVDEHAYADAIVCQAAADEVLRREITLKSSQEIGALVDSVLKRATGS